MFTELVEEVQQLDDGALDARLRRLEVDARRLEAERAAALAERERRTAGRADGFRSTVAWARGVRVTPERLVAAFTDRTLPKPEWTHEAHVTVCWATLQRLPPADALEHLRAAIRAYDDTVGTPNTDTSGYHETLTHYYVTAVAALADRPLDEVLADPSCSRTAPLEHWTRDRLFSVEARRAWLEPDLTPG